MVEFEFHFLSGNVPDRVLMDDRIIAPIDILEMRPEHPADHAVPLCRQRKKSRGTFSDRAGPSVLDHTQQLLQIRNIEQSRPTLGGRDGRHHDPQIAGRVSRDRLFGDHHSIFEDLGNALTQTVRGLHGAANRDGIQRLRDLHKLAGVWSMGLLFILVGTGALLALPTVKTQLLTATITAPDKVPEPQSSASRGRQISIATALAAAHRAVPDARLAFIDVPGAGTKPFRLRVQLPGDPHPRFPSSFVFIDQYSGAVLAVHDVRRGNAATTTAKWIRVLHDGSIAGLSTRILAVILGIVPLGLFVTGFLHWRRRLAARAQAHRTGSFS